jgi:isopropylmalate/homocitrate/citramalate synthase
MPVLKFAQLSPRSQVRFYDTTLRDGEQTVGVFLSAQQKLEIARKLDELGISRIEAGFPKVSPEDEAITLIRKADSRRSSGAFPEPSGETLKNWFASA